MGVAMTRRNGSPAFSSDSVRWAAVVGRDRRADGVFYYSVRTTGVYCRPSCAARLAKRDNIRFFRTVEQAERAGYRACKRCKPKDGPLAQQHRDAVARACRLMEGADDMPSLGD